MTYDPEADAVYLTVGKGTLDPTEEAGPFLYDVDAEGRVLALGQLAASLPAGRLTDGRIAKS